MSTEKTTLVISWFAQS